MRKNFFIFLYITGITYTSAFAQSLVEFASSDTALQNSFYRAKELALSYKGNPSDPVGPWYEAALPSRQAFCIRDVSHQSIGAEILGLSAENKNMLTHFVSNISASKDWCTYWEMNKFGKPAPEDYRNDNEFWYNLNANFELVYACWRMYQWTGDKAYINSPVFKRFFTATLTSYITRWKLEADSLLKRPPYLNAPVPFNVKDYFHRCRGIPSYYEARDDIKMGIDLIAAIARAYKSCAAMESLWDNRKKSEAYTRMAENYRKQIDEKWWDNSAQQYHTFYTNNSIFGNGEGATFLLWYDVLKDSSRIRKTIEQLADTTLNVENRSYLSYQFARYGYADEAYKNIVHLMHPATKRREYPEVSFGVMEGIVQGVMGVSADAGSNRITTLYNYPFQHCASIDHLNILSAEVNLKHCKKESTLTNNGKKTVTWRAAFHGNHSWLLMNGKKVKAFLQTDIMDNQTSYTDIRLLPGKTATVIVP